MLPKTRLYSPELYEIEILPTFKFTYKTLTLEHNIYHLTLPMYHK